MAMSVRSLEDRTLSGPILHVMPGSNGLLEYGAILAQSSAGGRTSSSAAASRCPGTKGSRPAGQRVDGGIGREVLRHRIHVAAGTPFHGRTEPHAHEEDRARLAARRRLCDAGLHSPAKPGDGGQTAALLDLYFAMTSESGTWPMETMQDWLQSSGLKPLKPVWMRNMPGAALVAGRNP